MTVDAGREGGVEGAAWGCEGEGGVEGKRGREGEKGRGEYNTLHQEIDIHSTANEKNWLEYNVPPTCESLGAIQGASGACTFALSWAIADTLSRPCIQCTILIPV